ncbi:MAG: SusC/RagA family TonB-linked outer membrane protein [Dysgonamonadaceae bacterium]|jgi:TonB-linked SusC/RagA family outer membrane protein|nr:SusC/RagA family TonB-linked outer membrane protein [Dysgonamonadaceae bacterium]
MTTRKGKKFLSMLVTGFLLCYPGSYALAGGEDSGESADVQQTGRTVTGTVVDVQGEPLIGVNVSIQGTSRGVGTDMNGKYSIQVQGNNQVLQFSYIGYKAVLITADKNVIDVTMEEDAEVLGEVVITGEFGLKRIGRSVGSSAQNVKASEIIESGRDNFITALQGRVAGMNVVSSGGAPGASTTVTLRSMTSLTGNNQPIYVVDGVPMNNSSFNPSRGFANMDQYASRSLDFSSRGNDFNPEDIESMTILKGAAAAALYGSDASNGAIIITTRKGTPGQGKVSYSNSFRWDSAYGIPERQTKYMNGAYGVTNFYNLNNYGGLFPEGTPIYDNVAAVLQTGFSSKHNVSVEGGTEQLTLRATASFTDQTGVIKSTDYTRNNLSLSGKAQITKWLRFEASMQYAGTTNNKAMKGTSGPLYYAMRWPIFDDMTNYLDPDGSHMRYPERYVDGDLINPMFQLYHNKYYDETDRFIGNATAIITPTKNTFLRIQWGSDVGAQTFEASEHPYWATYNYNVAAGVGGAYNMTKANFSDNNLNAIAGWENKFLNDKLDIQVHFGYHQLDNGIANLSSYGRNYSVLDLISINNTDPETQTSKKRVATRRLQALSGEIALGYDMMAYLTLRARNDWSSTLPKANNSFFYPAAEFSYVATELPFLKGNQVVNFFKLRGAIAQVGKDASPLAINPELIPTTWTGGGYKYDFTGPNRDLKPEMTTSTEIGFEGRFLNDRIDANFTYFNTHCDDQIIQDFRMSYASGFVTNTRNIGSFKTWGWEAHIDGDIIRTKDLLWNLGLNLSHTGSKITALPVPMYYDAYTWNSGNIRSGGFVGKPFTVILGNDYQRNDAGQVLIDPSSGLPVAGTDLVPLGDREPDLRLGLTTRIRYKGWHLLGMFAGKLGATVVNGTKRYMFSNGSSWESVTAREAGPVIFNGVLKDGNENTGHPTVNDIAVTSGLTGTTLYTGLDPDWIEKDVHYLRMQEVRLAYTIPQRSLRTFTNGLISYATVFVTGNDLFTITNYSGIDAVGNTVSASAGGIGGEAYDTWALPSPRGFSCGLSLTF